MNHSRSEAPSRPVPRPDAGASNAGASDAGAQVAFQRVAEEHATTVLRVCRALVGVSDADDAWSETFLAALRAYPRLSGGANVEAWLVTIARRKCIDVLRARARDPIPTDALPAEHSSRLGLPGAGDEHAPLWQAIGRLPFVQRQAVVCHHLVGMSYADTAGIIGNSPAAARRAGADGIAALRRLLTEGHPEPGGIAAPQPPRRKFPRARPGRPRATQSPPHHHPEGVTR